MVNCTHFLMDLSADVLKLDLIRNRPLLTQNQCPVQKELADTRKLSIIAPIILRLMRFQNEVLKLHKTQRTPTLAAT